MGDSDSFCFSDGEYIEGMTLTQHQTMKLLTSLAVVVLAATPMPSFAQIDTTIDANTVSTPATRSRIKKASGRAECVQHRPSFGEWFLWGSAAKRKTTCTKVEDVKEDEQDNSFTQRLTELKEAYEAGLLTQEEYAAGKATLLSTPVRDTSDAPQVQVIN